MMPWIVATLNASVDGEITALPADMRARLVRLSGLIEQIGFEALPRDTVKHLEGRLWELRVDSGSFASPVAMAFPAPFTSLQVASAW